MKLVTNLDGGKRNLVQLYKAGNDYVVKKKVKQSKMFDFYECEKQTLLDLNITDLTPKLLDYDDDEKSLTMTYIPSEHMKEDFRNYDLLLNRINELHSFDNIGKGFSFRRNPEPDLEDIVKIFRNLGMTLDKIEEIELREKYLPEIINKDKPSHGSLILTNVLVNNKGIYFIDFEMASKNNPFLDLAYLSAQIPQENVEGFVKKYTEIAKIDKELAIKEFDYARHHMCMLSVGLFLKDLKNKPAKDRDVDLARRSGQYLNHLERNYFHNPRGENLRAYFSKINEISKSIIDCGGRR